MAISHTVLAIYHPQIHFPCPLSSSTIAIEDESATLGLIAVDSWFRATDKALSHVVSGQRSVIVDR